MRTRTLQYTGAKPDTSPATTPLRPTLRCRERGERRAAGVRRRADSSVLEQAAGDHVRLDLVRAFEDGQHASIHEQA
jgi:hypothetical protein